MDKAQIIDAIKRTAEENGGMALGQERFAEMTGIGISKSRGKHWRTWSDAVSEAGLTPNLLDG
jgi:hypothetical protein